MFCILYFHLNWRQITKWLCSLDTLSRSNCQLVVRAFWHRLKDPDLIVHPASSPSGPGLVNRLKRKRQGNIELSSSWRPRGWNSMLRNYFVMFVQRSRLFSPLNLPRWLSVQVWSGVDGGQTLSTIQQSGPSRSLAEWLSPLFKSAFLRRDRLEGTKVEWRFGCEHTQSQNFLTDFCFAFSLHLSNSITYKDIDNQRKLATKQCTEKYNILPKIHWFTLNYLKLEVAITSIILLMHVEKRFHIGEQLIDRNVRWQCAGIKLKISIRKIFWAHMSAGKHNSGFYCRINVNWRSARLLPESRGNWGQGVAGLTTPTVQLKNWIHLHKNAVPGLIPVWRVWYGGGWAKNWSQDDGAGWAHSGELR